MAPGLALADRLALLRRLLAAGLPADFWTSLTRLTGVPTQPEAAIDLLSTAFLTGQPEVARLLYSFGARLATARITPGDGPLQAFILCKRDTALIRAALEFDFEPNQVMGIDQRVITPLCFAVVVDLPLDIVCTIAKLGADDVDEVYEYALMAKPHRTDVLLHFAFEATPHDPAPQFNVTPDALYSALRAVLSVGNLELVQLLVTAAKERGRTDWKQNRRLLMHAIYSLKLPIVQYLLDEGLEKQDFTLQDFPYRDATVDILEYFLDSGMPLPDLLDTEIELEDGRYDDPHEVSPLIYAAQYGNVAVLRALIRRGVHKIEAQLWSKRGATRRHVLHFAARATEGDAAGCLEELLNAGMHPDVLDHKNRSALHHAAKRGDGDAIYALIGAGASPVKDINGHLPVDLLSLGPDDDDCIDMLTELCYAHKLE